MRDIIEINDMKIYINSRSVESGGYETLIFVPAERPMVKHFDTQEEMIAYHNAIVKTLKGEKINED